MCMKNVRSNHIVTSLNGHNGLNVQHYAVLVHENGQEHVKGKFSRIE